MSASKRAAAAQAVATTDVDGIDISEFVGAGLEHADAESFAIPFLRVLQTNSPEVDEGHAKFVNGARAGMLLNTVTGELYDGKEGALFVPCSYERKQLRWAPRGASTQGFRGELTEVEVAQARANGALVDHRGRLYFSEDGKVDEKKNDRLVDTRLHFGLLLDADMVPHQVLMSLASTQIKKSKLFNSMQKERTSVHNGKVITDPTFLHMYRITTVKESNDQGSWFGVHFVYEGKVPNAAVFQTAAAFYKALLRKEVKINYAEAGEQTDRDADNDNDDTF